MNEKLLLRGLSGKLHHKTSADIFIGISSRINRCRHIILIDYDKSLNWKEELMFLIKKYHLSPFYVFRTSRSHYSAMCFTSISFKTYVKILLESDCCVNFRYYTVRAKCGTLRIRKKPQKKSSKLKFVRRFCVLNYIENENVKVRDMVFKMIDKEDGELWQKHT